MIQKKFVSIIRGLLALILLSASYNSAAISVTGTVSVEGGQVQLSQAATTIRWYWFEIASYEQVRAYARIRIGTTQNVDEETCTNFVNTSLQTCVALAHLNQCTEGCPYTGNGNGKKIDNLLGVITVEDIDSWGPVTKICNSGSGEL